MIEFDDNYISDSTVEWRTSGKGNFVCIRNDRIAATVFNPPRAEAGVWRIIINRAHGGYIVQEEYFTDADVAQERAEAILDGAAAHLKFMRPRDN